MSKSSTSPLVLYVGKDTHTKIVLNTALPSKVLTIVLNGSPVLSLSAIEAQDLLDLLSTKAYAIDRLVHEVRAAMYNYTSH